jgi:hypothetical protein
MRMRNKRSDKKDPKITLTRSLLTISRDSATSNLPRPVSPALFKPARCVAIQPPRRMSAFRGKADSFSCNQHVR